MGLSEKEFDLVNLLATHPGRVYTRAEISQRLLDGTSAGSNLVDVHISNLRGKLRKRGGFGLIRTVRGIGYCLKVP
ncbi:winged helix-turn-helix domain-containing protein [Deinococcus malanensis]|uniref:winged helix-turn-helix domain-containing protein n=1 Tax=Deinococcus malanensis TaxID=1706855 RepID=UPI0036432171